MTVEQFIAELDELVDAVRGVAKTRGKAARAPEVRRCGSVNCGEGRTCESPFKR
jgi:hypothetical protein